jgi:hypothetical protein
MNRRLRSCGTTPVSGLGAAGATAVIRSKIVPSC